MNNLDRILWLVTENMLKLIMSFGITQKLLFQYLKKTIPSLQLFSDGKNQIGLFVLNTAVFWNLHFFQISSLF